VWVVLGVLPDDRFPAHTQSEACLPISRQLDRRKAGRSVGTDEAVPVFVRPRRGQRAPPVAADQGIGIRPLQTHEFEAVGLKLTATGAAARRTSFGKHTKEVTTINMRLDLMRHE